MIYVSPHGKTAPEHQSDREHEPGFFRHPVWMEPAAIEYERHLRVFGRAKPDQLPILWLAAPLTGLIVQPIIGHLVDRTWGRLGRRRPYFVTGAILCSAALIPLPDSFTLCVPAVLLGILVPPFYVRLEPL